MRSLILALAFSAAAAPQDALNPEWVRLDLEGAARIGKLMPLRVQTPESIATILGDPRPRREDTSFGGELFVVGRGHGYAGTGVYGFAFRGRLARAKVAILFDSHAKGTRGRVMEAWKAGGGPAYTCLGDLCFHEWIDPDVLAAYRQAVAAALGPQAHVEVPDGLKKHYDYLMSPYENAAVSPGICGLPLPNEPVRGEPGYEAIEALVKARRMDLIANVLRGYNAGARVYALIALQDLRRSGVHLDPAVAESMRKVENLNVRVSACSGCTFHRTLRVRDAVHWWRSLHKGVLGSSEE
jgi:hypothetical protein